MSVIYADRYTLTGEGFYDGIGVDDFDAFGGSLGISMPIADGVSVGGEAFMTGSDASADAGDEPPGEPAQTRRSPLSV